MIGTILILALAVCAWVGLQLVFAPWTVVAITLAVGIGIVCHEVVHFIVAKFVGARDVKLAVAGRPEVHYRGTARQIRAVNLAPSIAAILGIILLLVATPDQLAVAAVTGGFCVGLFGFSLADWRLSYATR